MWPSSTHRGLLILFLGFYVLVCLRHLDTTPPFTSEEGAITAAALDPQQPQSVRVHPLLLAGLFKATGAELTTARVLSVVMGLLVLFLTYALGHRLFGADVGLAAVFLLLFVRLTSSPPVQPSGIPFIDHARLVQADMTAALFCLASFHAYLKGLARLQADVVSGTVRPRLRLETADPTSDAADPPSDTSVLWMAASGLLAGMSVLCGPIGVAWVAAAAVIALADRVGWARLATLLVMSTLPLGAALARDSHAVASIFDPPPPDLLSAASAGVSRTLRARGWLPTLGRWVEAIRPGQWAAVVAVPLACGALVRQVGTADEAARRLAIAIGMLAAGVAAVQWLDAGQPVAGVWSRALPLLPFVALAIARLCRAILARTSDGDQRTRAAAVLMMVAFAVTAEGLSRHLLLEYQGLVSTPYGSYVASVRRYVPPGVRVLGPPRLALGFSTSDYRSWTAPLADSDPRGPAPVSLTSVLDRVAPDVILMDAGPQSLVRSDDGDPRGPALRQWLRDHRFGERSLVFDRTYGTLRVYRR